MTSGRSEGRPYPLLATLCLLLCSFFSPLSADAESPPTLDIPPLSADREAWLVTIAPGEIYWQRFGHNAIWLREPALGLDHTFNFGYFDFEQEDFFLRFLTGRMLYQSLAFEATQELVSYAREGRAIRAQRLELTDAEYDRLRDHLLWHVQPANRDYLYDYYRDNCSTRIRDAIDLALNGALSMATGERPAEANFRDHTRRLTGMTFWYYLGLETVLGHPVDREVSRWDEMFIPGVLAETVGSPTLLPNRGPLVSETPWIYPGVWEGSADMLWWRYLAFSLAVLAAAWLVARRNIRRAGLLARAWLIAMGLLGVVIVVLWVATNHQVVGPNANLLLLNPLFLFLTGRDRWKALLALAAAGGVLALVQWAALGWQYNLDVVALVLPLNLAAALALRYVFNGTRKR